MHAYATMAGMGWDILGHTWAADMLQRHIATGGLRHAYLFTGPRGVGRRTLALRFAQAVNCVNPLQPGVPCGECRICRQIERMQQADLTIVQSEAEGASLKVDQVRDLQRTLSLAPYESAYRIALLQRFEEATEGAQNALLKTLEEPNPKVLLLVTADDPDNLLPTIVSRCELLRLRPMKLDELGSVLIATKGLESQKARLIAHVAGGRAGYAFGLAEDEELWAVRDTWLNDFFTLLSGSKSARLAYSDGKARGRERAETRLDLRDGLTHWLSLWRDVLLVATGSDTPLTNLDREEEIRRLAQSVSEKRTADLVRRLEHSFTRLPMANLQLLLDNLLLEWPVFR
ncbi:MAG: DNA polymerase III subunit delta' [Chloroflexi bacterium]|nr:DNA polymerase III subunit delta' [Chloroflexota bacterium]